MLSLFGAAKEGHRRLRLENLSGLQAYLDQSIRQRNFCLKAYKYITQILPIAILGSLF